VFLLESAVRPSIDQTLVIAERMRSTVMALAKKRTEAVPRQFSGKDHDDAPLTGHEHAYFLPLARHGSDGRKVIDRMLIWARDGFSPDAWACLQQLASSGRRLRGQADEHPLELILAGYGDFDHLCKMLPVRPERPHDGSWLGPSRTWVSATPFVPPRFTKVRRGQVIDTPADQLRWLIHEVLGHDVSKIEPDKAKGTFGWNRFVRVRKKDRSRPAGRDGWGFRITFAEPVRGPIALGYGAHFGLGLFCPESR
jgi:CRISPR-associated protein Csb2